MQKIVHTAGAEGLADCKKDTNNLVKGLELSNVPKTKEQFVQLWAINLCRLQVIAHTEICPCFAGVREAD